MSCYIIIKDLMRCAALHEREYNDQVPYGVIKANDHRVQEIIEKPTHRYFVNTGIKLVEPIFNKKLKKK
jgi:hypothetical protein